MNLPRLFKTTKTGATQICDISAENGKFTVTFGQLGGKMQTKETVCSSRNIGKSNETTPTKQAELEAQSKWEKKVKSGYSETITNIPKPSLPMKVKVYQDQLHNVVFPCVSTFKYNGVNGLYRLENVLNLYSRGGNLYPNIPHLEAEILSRMEELGTDELNGELYIPDYHLQDITSAVKKTKPSSAKLEFILFDAPNLGGTFEERLEAMKALPLSPKLTPDGHITLAPYKICNSHQDIEDHYNLAMSLGLEGVVIKNLSGTYEHGTRSSDQFKYKKAQDAEFQIIAYEFDKNNHVVYTCRTPEGLNFKVKRKGTNAERELDAQNAQNNLGKWLTVSFEVYSKAQVPLKPIGLNFRNCDINGEPLE